jgi:UDP-N-acetyl-D-glucosamine dehydrogenase
MDAVGVDISAARVAELQALQINDVYTTPAMAGDVDVWIMTTSTGPGLQYLFDAAASISPKPGALVSVESTLPVGAMTQLAAHFAGRGYAVGSDLFLAHVPHRILFGVEQSVFEAARVVAGVTPACRAKALAFYAPLVSALYPVSDVRVAELAKIIENALRFVDIAFAEEVFRYCQVHGIDFGELRAAVNTKANVHLLDVDYGIGGECLPKDIRFLQEALVSPLLMGAMAAEEHYRSFLQGLAEGHERILVKGLTFKPGHPDTRFSMAVALARALQARGKRVYVFDPLIGRAAVEALGFEWGEPDGAYDLVYERPLAIITTKEVGSHEPHPGDRQ